MRAVTRFFDGIVEPMFKQGADGRPVFFVFGIWGRGRILPDGAAAASLKRQLKAWYMALFGLIFVGGAIFGPVIAQGSDWRPVILCALVGIGHSALMSLALWWQVRRFPHSEERLRYADATAAQARLLGPRWMLVLFAGSLLATVFGLLLLATDPSRWLANLGAASFFAVLSVVFWRQWRQARESATG